MTDIYNNKLATITFTILLIILPIGISSVKLFYNPFNNNTNQVKYVKQSELRKAKTRLQKYKTVMSIKKLL